MAPTTSSIGAPTRTRPTLRARTKHGGAFENPSLDLLRTLVFGLGPGNPYLVIDQVDMPDGDHYAQALHRSDGSWVVEYRDGSRSRHFQAFAPGPSVVYQVLAGWALHLPDWQHPLAWRPVFQ